MLQFMKNEADHHGRSSRSPVMLFDIQDNNNVNSFAVRWYRVSLDPERSDLEKIMCRLSDLIVCLTF